VLCLSCGLYDGIGRRAEVGRAPPVPPHTLPTPCDAPPHAGPRTRRSSVRLSPPHPRPVSLVCWCHRPAARWCAGCYFLGQPTIAVRRRPTVSRLRHRQFRVPDCVPRACDMICWSPIVVFLSRSSALRGRSCHLWRDVTLRLARLFPLRPVRIGGDWSCFYSLSDRHFPLLGAWFSFRSRGVTLRARPLFCGPGFGPLVLLCLTGRV